MKRKFTKHPKTINAFTYINMKDKDVTLYDFFDSANVWSDEPVDPSECGIDIRIAPSGDGGYRISYYGINNPMGNEESGIVTLGDLFYSFEMFFGMDD